MGRAFTAIAILAAVLAFTGCAKDADVQTATQTSPFDPCSIAGTEAPEPPPGSAPPVPAITLPCFTGGEPVSIAGLGRPAVVNLWASWCAPCRTELPELQRFADLGSDQITVLGVVTGDTRARAAAAAEDFGIRFPAVFDPDRSLLTRLGRNALPVTLFLDARGGVRHLYQGGEPLTVSTLEQLTRRHLGVVVS